MDEEKKLLTIEEIEEELKRNPEKEELKVDLAEALLGRLDYLYDKKNSDPEKKDTINRLKEVLKKLPQEWTYYYRAYLAYIHNDKKGVFNWLIKYAARFSTVYKEEPFTSDELSFLFLERYFPSPKGLWNKIAETLEENWPDSAVVPTLRGFEQLDIEKDNYSAIDYFTQALAKDEDYWVASLGCGYAYLFEKKWKQAYNNYKRSLESEVAKEWTNVYFSLALCCDKLKKYKEQEEALRNGLKVDPESKYSRNNLGLCLMKQKRYEEAIEVFDEAIERGLDGKYPIRNKVRALEKLGRYKEAIDVINNELPKKLTKYEQELLDGLRKLISKGRFEPPETTDIEEEIEEEDEEIAITEEEQILEEKETEVKHIAVGKEKILEDLIEARIVRGEKTFDRNLKIYETDYHYGRQFGIPDIGRIDLLAIDTNTNDYVVIELKRDRSEDEVVGQTSRYMAWVRDNMCGEGQDVFGIICVNKVTKRLKLSASNISNIKLFEYDLTFKRIM